LQTDLFQQLVKKLARSTNKGQALLILVKTRRFADKHDIGICRTGAGHGFGPRFVQDALFTNSNLLIECLQF